MCMNIHYRLGLHIQNDSRYQLRVPIYHIFFILTGIIQFKELFTY